MRFLEIQGDPEYDKIFVVDDSLGSVIVDGTLNRLSTRTRRTEARQNFWM